MLKKRKIAVLVIFFAAVIFLLPDLVQAQGAEFGVNDSALVDTGLSTRNLKEIIGNILNILLGFLGLLAVLIILYGGWTWMTSKGNADQIEKAKKILINGVIGLVIILVSFIIVRFIFKDIGGGIIGGGNGDDPYHGGIGLGGGVIESHYPARNATGIPRNTNIYITFKEAIEVDSANSGSLVTNDPADCDYAPEYCASANIDLINRATGISVETNKILATFDADQKVFRFNPYSDDIEHLGTPDGNTLYRVILLPDIRKADGDLAFTLNGYDWEFTVSNVVDLTPPKITSVVPAPNSDDNPRNSVVQINFSEAVDPLTASGVVADGYDYITVDKMAPPPPALLFGQYLISNQYRTVEFLTDDLCGTNSCGGDVYCLPGGADIRAVVTDNITDMAGNELDGDDDDVAGGDYVWFFSTNNIIDLSPPQISSMPDDYNNFAIDEPVRLIFSKPLLSSSIKTDNINLVEQPDIAMNYWLSSSVDKIYIHHDELDPLTGYSPTLTSNIQDTTQNCWYPCACDDPAGSCVCDPPSGPDCPGTNCQIPWP